MSYLAIVFNTDSNLLLLIGSATMVGDEVTDVNECDVDGVDGDADEVASGSELVI